MTVPLDARPLPPLRFEPILKRLIWGGRRLGELLGKPIGPEGDYAESWELSDHRHGQSRVFGGPFEGTTLHDLVQDRGPELLGTAVAPRSQFPLLIKFIDAQQVLSVQVHPDDQAARRLADDNGKNESWVVIAAEAGALIYAGLKAGVTRSKFAEAITEGRVGDLLHAFEAKVGDCIHIPAGTVHAIGAGVMLAEVQQMSDATFRVDDWGRLGADGRPRRLHVEEAIEVTDFESGPVGPVESRPEPIAGGRLERLVRCPFFRLDRLTIDGQGCVGDPQGARFTAVVGLGGAAVLRHGGASHPIGLGQTLLLPATLGPCAIAAEGVEAVVLACTIP